MGLNECLSALSSIIWEDGHGKIRTQLRFSQSKYWRLLLMDEVVIPVFLDGRRKLSDLFGHNGEYMLLSDIVDLIERKINVKIYPPPERRVRMIDKGQVRRDVGRPMCVLKLLQGNEGKGRRRLIQVYVKGPLLSRCDTDERCKEFVRNLRKIIVLEKVWHLKLYDCSFLLDAKEKANIYEEIDRLAKEIKAFNLAQLKDIEVQLCDAKIKFCEFVRNQIPDTVIGRR